MRIKAVYRIQNRVTLKTVLFLSVCIFIILIFCGNYMNADYVAYQILYEHYYPYNAITYQESGFRLLNYHAYMLGMSFFVFKNIFLLTAFMILLAALIRFSCLNRSDLFYVILIFFFFCMPYQLVQIRMFMSSSLILFGASFLKERRKRNVLLFFLFLFLGACIHITAIVGIIFLIPYHYTNTKKLRSFFLVSSFFTVFLAFFARNVITSLELQLVSFFSFIRVTHIFSTIDGLFVSWKNITMYIACIFCSILLLADHSKDDSDYLSRLCTLFPLIIVMAMTIPEGQRLVRGPILLYAIDILRRDRHKPYLRKYCYYVFLLVIVICGCSHWIPFASSFKHVTMPLFTENYIFHF